MTNAPPFVLFESVFGNSLVCYKKWKYKIHYSGEPYTNKNSNYDLILYPKYKTTKTEAPINTFLIILDFF